MKPESVIPLLLLAAHASATAGVDAVVEAQGALVKLYGPGRIAGVEGYQTGAVVDERGRVLTVDAVLLEEGYASVADAYGQRYDATLVGVDERTGLALLEPAAAVEPIAWLELTDQPPPQRATRLWAVSNAFAIATGDEPLSVQRARLAAVTRFPSPPESRSAVRRAIGAPQAGVEVLLLDAITSNPGAPGGAVLDRTGRLVGVLGAETRSGVSGAWLNYAVSAREALAAIGRIDSAEGGADRLTERAAAPPIAVAERLGVLFVPAVAWRTPSYVDSVEPGTPAARADLRPNDLVVAVDGVGVGTVAAAAGALVSSAGSGRPIELTVLREDRLVTLYVVVEADQ